MTNKVHVLGVGMVKFAKPGKSDGAITIKQTLALTPPSERQQ